MALAARLLDIPAERLDLERLDNDQPEKLRFQSFSDYASKVLEVLRDELPDINRAWILVSGFEPGFLTPIAALPPDAIGTLPKVSKSEAQGLARGVELEVVERRQVSASIQIASLSTYVIRLIGSLEYYGLLILVPRSGTSFTYKTLGRMKEVLPLLNRLLAEANFSMRLTAIASPYQLKAGRLAVSEMYSQMAAHACRGLAADGAVVRIASSNDSADYSLDTVASHGQVLSHQLEPGESICRIVYKSEEGLTVQNTDFDGRRREVGAVIPEGLDDALRRDGIGAYMILRLTSDLVSGGSAAHFGIISVFHRTPQVFSRRDVNLFKTLAERMADDLALLRQRDENESLANLLLAQNSLGTRAEVIALLGHDFGHKVQHIAANVQEFLEAAQRQWKKENSAPPKSVVQTAASLKASADELAQIVRQVRLLAQGNEVVDEHFVVDSDATQGTVKGLFQEIGDSLMTVLEANHMRLAVKSVGNTQMHGPKSILKQVLFNLIINAIDAQKTSGNRKLNTVHLTCRETGRHDSRKLEFNVWDEGPGISRSDFPDAAKIFEIGATSKPQGVGTGTGLPVARSMLGRYFRSDLQLVDRSKALFQFAIACP